MLHKGDPCLRSPHRKQPLAWFASGAPLWHPIRNATLVSLGTPLSPPDALALASVGGPALRKTGTTLAAFSGSTQSVERGLDMSCLATMLSHAGGVGREGARGDGRSKSGSIRGRKSNPLNPTSRSATRSQRMPPTSPHCTMFVGTPENQRIMYSAS